MIHPFLAACGATGPLLLSTESPGSTGVETRAFDLPFVLAGRDPRSDLRLTHADVSDRHAYLQLVDGQLLCIDLGSRIGIYQGGKCQRLAYVEREQAVRVGPYRLRLLGGDSGGDTHADAPCPPLPLTLSHRAVRQSRCVLPRGLALVGSAADCQIRLIDPSVSNYHCSLVHTPQGVWVVDLLSQGGVRVNGQEVGYAQLHEGDALQVGHSVIRLTDDTEETTPGVEIRPAAPRVTDSQAPETGTGYLQPAGVQEPATAQTAELVERVLGPMVSQVGILQQQMVEEFHQARAMLFETFSTLHQEQTAFINQELDQIRQLSQELHALHADLERQTRLLSEQLLSGLNPARLGTATTSAPLAGHAASASGSDRLPAISHRHNLNGVHTPAATATARAAPANGTVRAHNEQAHARLCERIARLTTKQQTRWQKLLAMLPGGSNPHKLTT